MQGSISKLFRSAAKTEIFFEQKNYSQVSEKLWGATATLTKAVAATRKKTINIHDGVGFYLATLSKELKDKTILDIISMDNFMHQNFYEDNLPPEVIPEGVSEN